MLIISHRGNIDGPCAAKDNNPEWIAKLLNLDVHVEVDLRLTSNGLWLGHDAPQYKVDVDFIKKKNLWVHAKDIETMSYLISEHIEDITFFYHTHEDVVLTTNGYLWTRPGLELTKSSICVLPELFDIPYVNPIAYGVCTDYYNRYRKIEV